MKIEHNATLLRVYVAESARYRGRDLASAIIEAMARAGIAGATAFKGIAGYGRSRFVSSSRIVDAWMDLPVLIEVVDEQERIRRFVADLEALHQDALVTVERVQMLLYRPETGA